MKRALFSFVLVAIFGFGIVASGLTDAERTLGVKEMTKTSKHLQKTVKGLDDAQLNFKPSEEAWSIAECLEHIAISEENIFGMLEGALKTPADPSKRSEVKMQDEQILKMIADRSNKVKTSKPFEPTGKYGSVKATLKTFLAKRKANIKYLKTTDDDLRNHYGQLPFGTIDGLQILLFMSAHTERHVLQMEEVMAHENFPK